MKDLKYEHQSTNMNTKFWGGGGRAGVGGGVGYYNFPRSTNKIQFLTKFPHLEKIVDLMKALKFEHQSIFAMWGRVKCNLRDRYRKPNIVFNNSSCYQFFSSNSQKLSLWCKKKIIPHPYGFV